MILNEVNIEEHKEIWEKKGYKLPGFSRKQVREYTKKHPVWLHFGAGNIFRALHGKIAQTLLNASEMESGIIVAEGYDYEIIEKINRVTDDYSVLVTLKADGTIEKEIVGSITESCILDSENQNEFERMKEIVKEETLQMITFTITEKGYCLTSGNGEYLSDVVKDFASGPEKPGSYMGKIAALLYHRFVNGAYPVAMVSTDNCSHNGDKLYEAVVQFAEKWETSGLVKKGFVAYVKDRKKVSFPWTMIDKITPRPDENIEVMLTNDGIEGITPMITRKHTYSAAFVNAEESEYLVIEDDFPNGRPPLEKAGVILTDRQTVDNVERMKVCTCLNPLHTALAVFGCLLGYNKIADEMENETLRKMTEQLGYAEGLPVVTNPRVIDPRVFIDTVINARIPNRFLPDSPWRIITDTSQKLSIRFGETIIAYAKENRTNELKMIPLVFAGWLRYLMGVDDNGIAYQLSPDPGLKELSSCVSVFKLGENLPKAEIETHLRKLLMDKNIWGVDLYQVSLADKVLSYFSEFIREKGAVREVLRRNVYN